MKTLKTITALILITMLIAAFAGCAGSQNISEPTAVPASENSQAQEPAKATEAPVADDPAASNEFKIVVNDNLTITDPEGLDFDERAVLFADINNPTLQMYVGMGVNVDMLYMVVYAKDGVVIAEYSYYVFADEASAATFQAMAPTMTVEGLIGMNVSDRDIIEGTIIQMQLAGVMNGETLDDYVGMYEAAYGYTRVEY